MASRKRSAFRSRVSGERYRRTGRRVHSRRDPELHEEYIKFRKLLRKVASEFTKSRWQSTDRVHALEHLLTEVSKLPIDDPLDQCITEAALREVPGAVARLRKLSAMDLAKRPGEEITSYFRQAVACYVCGLYD